MNSKFDQFVDCCRVFLGNKNSVTDEEIKDAVGKVSVLFPGINPEEVKKEILSLYTTSIFECKKLVDNRNPGAGWLSKNDYLEKQSIDWGFWNRYRKHLQLNERFQPGVIHQLDRITDEILDNLFNPKLNLNIEKKGLVVGQVQSGKTSNFTGLICKAVDSGFNVVIVLAGLLDDLRTQTQNRIEKCFLGISTKNSKVNTEKEYVGVGLIDKTPVAHAFTTVENDFKETTVNALGVNLNSEVPVIFVVKKNSRILNNLRKWLSKKDLSSKTLLMIDDEADNASVNTSKDKTKKSPINDKIRGVLALFQRSAYVGYTATPYANIFINSSDIGDLFPRHFIINLPTPPSYLSPEKVFGLRDLTEQNEDKQTNLQIENPLPIVNVVNDYKSFVSDKHKKNESGSLTYDNIPDSLKYAIRSFIIACAVRMARGQRKKHNSMLIHLSRYQVWQNKIKEIVERCFKFYQNEIVSDDPSFLEQLRKDYEEDYVCGSKTYKSFVHINSEINKTEHDIINKGCKCLSWDDVKPYLYDAVDKIVVKSLNGASEDTLCYEEHIDDGYYVIAIGGDKLSRGLTLEGLTISYFLRASKMYDTLMQMGRWFGYRLGYVDVCRLFVSEEINNWFINITIANNELREEFDYLWQRKKTPHEYSLKVRTSPGLFVTSPLKMRSSMDIQISWAATLVETYSLIRKQSVKEENFNVTREFIDNLGQDYKENKQGYLWTNVPYDKVCDYISKFKIPESSRLKMNFDRMVNYIKTCVTMHSELNSWRIVVRNNTTKETGCCYSFNKKINGKCTYRTRVDSPNVSEDLYNLKNYHLISGPKDEFLDMYILEEDKYLTPAIKDGQKYPSPKVVRQEYRPSENPLMIIYPLDPKGAKCCEDNLTCIANETPYIGFAIVFPSSSNTQGVKYKVNMVEDIMDTEIMFDDQNDNIYPDGQ